MLHGKTLKRERVLVWCVCGTFFVLLYLFLHVHLLLYGDSCHALPSTDGFMEAYVQSFNDFVVMWVHCCSIIFYVLTLDFNDPQREMCVPTHREPNRKNEVEEWSAIP